MRTIFRLTFGIAAVLVLAVAAIFLFRRPIVETAVETLMARAGAERPDVTVADVSLSRLTMAKVAAGAADAPGLSLDNVAIDYDWNDLLFAARVKSASIGGGSIVLAADDAGKISIAGWSPRPKEKAAQSTPPLRSLALQSVGIVARTPEGEAMINVDGAFDFDRGGHFEIGLKAARAGFSALSIANAAGRATIRLDADGAIAAAASLKGDVAAKAGEAREVDVEGSAALASWRDFLGRDRRPLEGEARLALNASTIEAGSAPFLARLSSAGGSPIGQARLAGGLLAALSAEGIEISSSGEPLTLAADRGDRLVVTGLDGPIYSRSAERTRVAVRARIDGPAARGEATVEAASADGSSWRVAATASLDEQAVPGLSLKGLEAAFRGDYANDGWTGEADIDTHVNSAEIGRLRIKDMPAAASLAIKADMKGKSLSATPVGESCLAVDRANIVLLDQDMDARVAEAALCPGASPLIRVDWGASPMTHIEGALTAGEARLRIGRTEFDGGPPRIDFAMNYDPSASTSRITGDFSGGRVLLNKSFILSNAKGAFEAGFAGPALSAKASLSAMRIAQNEKAAFIAPVAVSGGASLANEVAHFDFRVATPAGAPLGRGEGVHQVRTGKGQAIFDSGLLKYSPGLQPDRLLPVLKGVISGATGAMQGRARFDWAGDDLQSSATVSLENFSFQGPGVAVTRTEGVDGKLAFSSLAPVATAGEQSISIRKIDMDALKLENGKMRFELPGDDTLKIYEAEFPWFGGTIGAYNSTMSIAGGESTTSLQLDDVDLGALLSYINVEGLTGEGTIEGVLPLSIEGARGRISNGILSSKGTGVIRYVGQATSAAAQSNEQSALAFEILRELRFERLSATIDGPLDGTISFKILFEGRSDIPVKTGDKTQRVDSPVKYRLTINAPLLSLIEQAVLSTDVKRQIERARDEENRPKNEQ